LKGNCFSGWPRPDRRSEAQGSGGRGFEAVSFTAGSLRVNFQPGTAPVPDGYVADQGDAFGDRGNGLSYGWSSDHSAETRQRNNEPVSGTFCHFLDSQRWEVALPDGDYRITLQVGDASYGSDNVIRVEGVVVCRHLELNQSTRTLTKTVSLKDGRLTIDNGDSTGRVTKLCSLGIARE